MSFGAVASAGDPLKRGLVGWYRMLGNANDSSGKGNTGTLVNSPTAAADKYGNSNSAYTFALASSRHMTLAQNNGLPLYTDGASYSICGWVKGVAGQPGNTTIYGEGNSSSTSPLNFTYASGLNQAYLSHYLRDSGGAFRVGIITTSAVVFDDTWHHFSVTYNGSTGYTAIYVDSALSASNTYSTSWTMGAALNRSTVAALIRTGAPQFFFTGSLFDLRLYNRPLTADEVGTLYRATQRI